MENEELKKMLREMAVSAGNDTNKKIDGFSTLLIQIAFASVGLAAVYLETGARDHTSLLVSGVIFLVVSIFFGGIQMILDYRFFRENQLLLQQVNTALGKLESSAGSPTTTQYVMHVQILVQKMTEKSDASSICPLYFQIAFTLAGAGQVLFAFLSAV